MGGELKVVCDCCILRWNNGGAIGIEAGEVDGGQII